MSKQISNKVEYRSLSELKELEGNPRTITREKMNKLVDSIKANQDYFEARPIICSDRTGELVILAGNQRFKAAKIAGLTEVPVVVLHGLDEEIFKEVMKVWRQEQEKMYWREIKSLNKKKDLRRKKKIANVLR